MLIQGNKAKRIWLCLYISCSAICDFGVRREHAQFLKYPLGKGNKTGWEREKEKKEIEEFILDTLAVVHHGDWVGFWCVQMEYSGMEMYKESGR